MPLLPEEQWHSELDATQPQQATPYRGVNQDQPIGGTGILVGATWRQHNIATEVIHQLMNPLANEPTPGFKVKDNIPAGYEDRADKFAVAESKADIAQIKRQLDSDELDNQIIRSHGAGGYVATMAAGITSPETLASMFLPIAGETALARAGVQALQGAGTQAVTEFAQKQLGKDTGDSAMNIGAAAIGGGILGTIFGHVPVSRRGKLIDNLAEDLRSIPENDPMLSGHSGLGGPAIERTPVDAEAYDLMMQQRAAMASKEAGLKATLEGPEAKAVAELGDHAPLEQAAAASKEEIAKLTEQLAEPKDQQIAAEVERLKSGPYIMEALQKRYSPEDLPGVLEQKATQAVEQKQEGLRQQLATHQGIVDEAAAAMERKGRVDQAQAEMAKLQEEKMAEMSADVPVPKPEVTIYGNAGESTAGAMRVGETTLEDEGADTPLGRWLTRSMVGRWSVGNRILSSPFKSARLAYQKLANVNTVLKKNSALVASESPVERDLWKHIDAGTMQDLRAQQGAYREYRERLTEQGDRPISYQEFNEQTGMAMRNADEHSIPEISKIAKRHRVEIDKAYKRLTDGIEKEKANLSELAKRDSTGELGVEEDLKNLNDFEQRLKEGTGSRTGEEAKRYALSYMMRQYDHVKIMNDPDGFFSLIKSHFMSENPGVDPAELDSAVHKVVMNIHGTERGLLDWKILDGAVSNTGRAKAIKLTMPDKELEPYLVNDINALMHSYRKSVYPQALITEKFGDRHMLGALADMRDEYTTKQQALLARTQQARAAGDTDTLKGLIGKGGEGDLLKEQYKETLGDLTAVRDRAYGIYKQPKNPAGAYLKLINAASGLRYINAASKLGAATLSHFGDLGGIMMRYGMTNTLGALGKMSTNAQLFKMSLEQAQQFGAALDMFMNSHNIMNTTSALLQGYEHSGTQGPVLNALSNLTRVVTTVSGETPLITLMQSLASTMAGHEITQVAGKLAAGQAVSDHILRRLAAGGLDARILQNIGKFDAKYGETVGGLRFANTHKWDTPWGEQAAAAFQSAVLREAHSVTLRPGIGDTPLHMSTWWGRTLQQFNSFAFAAQNAVLTPMVQGLSRGDPRMVTGLMALTTMGFLSYAAHRIAAGKPVELNQPLRMAGEIADKSNLTGAMGRFLFPIAGQLPMSNVSRYFDQDPDSLMLGASGQLMTDIYKRHLPSRILGSTLGMHSPDKPPDQIRRSDMHAFRKMVPGNNLWWARQGLDSMEDGIGNYFNLPGKPLRTENDQIQQD